MHGMTRWLAVCTVLSCVVAGQGLGKVVVSGVWLGVMGAWSLWILG